MTPLISILILNTRNCQQAVRCVQALQKQTIVDQIEILVIDNHSEDDSIGVLRNRLSDFTNVRIAENNKNLGFGGGYNRGVHYARGEYVLINNPDKILQPDGIELLVQKMQTESDIGILSPALVHEDGTYRFSPRAFPRPFDLLCNRTCLGKFFPSRLNRYLQLDQDLKEERDVDWLAGGCMLMRRDFYEQLGGFDERFFLFFEDIDLCRRCGELGKRVVYYPSVHARDKKKRFSEGSIFKLLRTRVGQAHLVSSVKYYKKWGV
jgi:N-acetylglucosaminyl-diphospho-decaprenol L-rhamnosyltransferase